MNRNNKREKKNGIACIVFKLYQYMVCDFNQYAFPVKKIFTLKCARFFFSHFRQKN